ncbi:MAG: hypothetical protein F6K10_01935 [Moorea sp. SIO2B7]|nr:hypothetical protein [Moorena sp. SIO2B7]
MKFNSTVVLTLLLLIMMIAAGSASAWWGFTIGYQALKGVTQPDVNPTKKLAGNKKASGNQKGLTLVKEREVLVRVYDHIYEHGGKSSKKKNQKKKDDNSFIKTSDQEQESSFITIPKPQIDLPIKGKDKGVTLELVKINQQGGSLLLDVNLKNDSRKAVRFLYSFLDVRDDQGRALSAITDGLPGELPANGENFSGTVRIPTALLDDAKEISLTLTDYPDQKLQLKISKIPVVK